MAQLAATEPGAVTVSFTFGLDLILDGLEALRGSSAWDGPGR